jgi:hypothetical protein
MSRVFTKESHEIIKAGQFLVYRQENLIAVPNVKYALATTPINLLKVIDLGKRNRLAT